MLHDQPFLIHYTPFLFTMQSDDQGPVLQRVDINCNLFAIDINRNYVQKR